MTAGGTSSGSSNPSRSCNGEMQSVAVEVRCRPGLRVRTYSTPALPVIPSGSGVLVERIGRGRRVYGRRVLELWRVAIRPGRVRVRWVSAEDIMPARSGPS
jgi:hypothetical protein